MTSENDIREKTRAVFLAAVMVMSVVAMTATFSGAAVAANLNGVDTDDYDVGETSQGGNTIGGEVDGSTYYEGQVIALDLEGTGVATGEQVVVREVTDTNNGNPVSTSQTIATTIEEDGDNDPYVLVRTSQTGTGTYLLEYDGQFLGDGNNPGDGTAFGEDLQSGSSPAAEFEVIEDSVSAEFVDDSARVNGEPAEIEFQTQRTGHTLTIEETDTQLDESELEDLFSQPSLSDINVQETGDNNITVQMDANYVNEDVYFNEGNSTDFDAGEYEFLAEVDDTSAEDVFSITVEEEQTADAQFLAPQYNVAAGDFAAVTLEVNGEPDYVLLQVGDKGDQGYQANVTIDPDEEETVVPVFGTSSTADSDDFDSSVGDDNTFLDGFENADTNGQTYRDYFVTLGQIAPSEEDGESDAEILNVTSDTELDNVLAPGQYDMAVGVETDGSAPTSPVENFGELDEDSVATLNVQERSTSGLNTWTAPGDESWGDDITRDGPFGSDRVDPWTQEGNLTQTDQIAVTDEERLDDLGSANGDWITAEVEVTGVNSMLSAFDYTSGATNNPATIEHGVSISSDASVHNDTIADDFGGTLAAYGAHTQPVPRDVPDTLDNDTNAANPIQTFTNRDAANVLPPQTGATPDSLSQANGGSTLDNNVLRFNVTQVDPDPNRSPYVLNSTAKMNWDITRGDGSLYLTADSDDVWFDREDQWALPTENGPQLSSDDVKNASELTGEEFEVEFNVSNTYLEAFTRDSVDSEDSEVVVDTFEFVDRELSYDGVDSDGVLRVSASEDATVTGTTSIAPGTEITVRARGTGDNAFLETSEVNVTADRTFEAQFDFSDRTQGQNFTLEVRDQGFDDDAEQDAQIGDAPVPATFNVGDLSPESAEVEPGTEIDVSATVSNDGDQEGTQSVELRLDGETVDSEELTLAGGDSQTVEFTDVAAPDEEGDYTHSIATNDSEASGTLTVATPAPADFQVSGLEPASATVAPGDSVDVSATVSNAGDQEATKTVELRVDGDTADSEDVTLAGGEEVSVDFSTDAPSEAGDYTHSVWTEDSEADGTLTVEEEEPADDEEEQMDDSEEQTDGNETADDEAADGEGPGFGVVVALLAFLGAALLAARRQVE